MTSFRFFSLLIILGGFLTSCKKSDSTPKAYIRIIHGSPNATAWDLSPDGQLLISNINYGSGTNYYKVNAGGLNIRLNATGSSTNVVANGDVVVQADKYYSIIAADSVSKLKIAVVNDDRTPAPSGKALIRFFHLVPNGGTYDFFNGAAALFTNRTFFDLTTNSSAVGYIPVDPGVITFAVRATTGGSIVTTLPSVNIMAGKVYTIVVRGFSGGSGNQGILMSLYSDN